MSSVADAERAAIAQAAKAHKETEDLLILSDSTTAINTVLELSEGRPPRSGIERALSTTLRKRTESGKNTRIAWVRGHIDIPGNEMADQKAAEATSRGGRIDLVTEEGWRTEIQKRRREARTQGGFGEDRYRWPRGAITAYTWCQTGKGPIRKWLHQVGKIEDPSCHVCGDGDGPIEDGEHLALQCTGIQGRPPGMRQWKDLDKPIWEGEGENRRDMVADFFAGLYGVLHRRQNQVGGGER